MTKLMLNTGLVPLHTKTGEPVPPGTIVLDDEMEVEDDALVHVRPSELPADAENLSPAAAKYASGNADERSGDDSGVKANPKGGKS